MSQMLRHVTKFTVPSVSSSSERAWGVGRTLVMGRSEVGAFLVVERAGRRRRRYQITKSPAAISARMDNIFHEDGLLTGLDTQETRR
jgi:hypothetical protein